MRLWISTVAALCVLAAAALAQDMRGQDVQLRGDWIQDDLPAALAAARKSGRPLLAVLRCVP